MSDGFLLYAYCEHPKGEPIGHIHILHGMAEHSGRYESSREFFIEQGHIVSGTDHRGHGKTATLNGMKGTFSDANGFTRVVEAADEVVYHRTAFGSPCTLIR